MAEPVSNLEVVLTADTSAFDEAMDRAEARVRALTEAVEELGHMIKEVSNDE